MQVNETLNEGLKRGYHITVTADELNAKVDEKLKEAQPEVEMKGFRKGKVPMAMLKKQFGPRILGEAMQDAIDGALKDRGMVSFAKVLTPADVEAIRAYVIDRSNWTKANLPDATAETFKDGWMHTGDLAREDEDGFYYIVDRTKDMIVTGGFNVFPREVEDVVAEHPSVAQVCVIGTPDEKWGEAVTAVVVLRPDAATDEAAVATMTAEIQAAVKERKGPVQSPKQVVVVDSVPITALGKPDKKAVRKQFWEGAGRSVG